MNRRFSSRKCDVSETDSETSSSQQTRRHGYNTRSTGKKSNASTTREENRSSPVVNKFLPTFQHNKNNTRRSPVRENSTPEMDYCHNNYPQTLPRKGTQRCCSILKTCFYVALLAGTSYALWSIYKMKSEIKELQHNQERTASSKGEDPQEKLLKELNNKCSKALKQLLQDPVGRADFALESSGGHIVSTDGVDYGSGPKMFFGFSLCREGPHSPSAMIRATSSPGECWAFRGQKASAIVQLIGHVQIDSVTLEHIPRTLSPTGSIDSAPKDFKIWGLPQPKRDKRTLLGEFVYETGGSTLQTFKTGNNTDFYKYMEFEVVSNHGNKEYTCVYRIRVHGKLRSF